MAWTAVGATAHGTAATLAVTNTTAGDIRVVWTGSSTAFPVVTAGGVTTWNIGVAYNGTSTSSFSEIYWGVVTATGAQTLSMTHTPFETYTREFAPPAGTVSLDVNGTLSGTTSAVIAGASLTPAGAGELWCGYSISVGSASTGTTTGVAYTNTTGSNCLGWDLNSPSGAFAPNWTQSGNWDTMALFLLTSGAAPAYAQPPVVTTLARKRGAFY